MKTILRWYGVYEKAIVGFLEWIVATEQRCAALVFLFLFGMGFGLAMQPYQAIADGAAWTDSYTYVSKSQIISTVVWHQAVPAILFLAASLFVPIYYLLRDARWVHALLDRLFSIRRPKWTITLGSKPKPRSNKFRRSKTKAQKDANWNWVGYLIAAAAYSLFLLYPLWFFVTALQHGLRWDSQARIYPAFHGPVVSLVVVGAYCLWMLLATLDIYLRQHHKSNLVVALMSLLIIDQRRKPAS